jgi:alanine-synthesizing transaminase
MFSSIAKRLPGETNALYKIRDEIRSGEHVIQDLISGNVNEHGISFPQEILDPILLNSSRASAVYRPDPLGQKAARIAISGYYQKQGSVIPPDNLLLTPGSSISYWYCFKLLANEGEEILCPRPSYPLFEYIALLSGVRMVPYTLDETRKWAIDMGELEACISTKTRALILISPHNPTGHVAGADEISALADVVERHDLAIISDEVFSEFLLEARTLPRPCNTAAPLVFTLNGFSKMFALPGLKLGWMAISGKADRVNQALKAAELISDTYLPVNEIIQAAVPDLMREGEGFLRFYSEQIRLRWQLAEDLFSRSGACRWTKPDGGFYVTLQLKDLDEEQVAETVLREDHLLVHPGYFYDMNPNHLVLSFAQNPDSLRDTLPRLLRRLEAMSLPRHKG